MTMPIKPIPRTLDELEREADEAHTHVDRARWFLRAAREAEEIARLRLAKYHAQHDERLARAFVAGENIRDVVLDDAQLRSNVVKSAADIAMFEGILHVLCRQSLAALHAHARAEQAQRSTTEVSA